MTRMLGLRWMRLWAGGYARNSASVLALGWRFSVVWRFSEIFTGQFRPAVNLDRFASGETGAALHRLVGRERDAEFCGCGALTPLERVAPLFKFVGGHGFTQQEWRRTMFDRVSAHAGVHHKTFADRFR